MILRIVFLLTALVPLLVPGPLPAQNNLGFYGLSFKTGMVLQEQLEQKFQNTLATIRTSTASDSDKQAQIQQATAHYQKESQALAVIYRDPVVDMVNQLASNTGVLVDINGNIIPTSGPSAPITTSTGTPSTDPASRGWASDTDAMGGTKTVQKIPDILDQMGLTKGQYALTTSGPDAAIKITPGYTTIKDLNLTVHTPSSAIGTAMGPPGSIAHETQVAVDVKSKETFVSESMTEDQPGKTYVAVMDHTKKANEGLKVSPDTLFNDDDALQNLAKGTMKAALELYGKDSMGTKLAEILANNNIQVPGIPPDQYGELLVNLKTGSAKAPDGVGITQKNIAEFQNACKAVLVQIQAEAKQTGDLQMQNIEAQIKAKEASGNPDDKAEAQKLREKAVDSKVKIGQSEKYNKPFTKPPAALANEPPTGNEVAIDKPKDEFSGAKKPATTDKDDAGQQTKPVAGKKKEGADPAKPGGQSGKGDSGGKGISQAPIVPDVTVKFFEKIYGKDSALLNDIKTGGIVGSDGKVASGLFQTQIGQAGVKSQFDVSAGQEGAKIATLQELEVNLIKIQNTTTVGNNTLTAALNTEGKVGANANLNMMAYTGPLGVGSAGGFDLFAGAKAGTSGSLMLDLKEWLGVSFEGNVGGEAGAGVGAKGYYNAELSWGGVKFKGGAAGYTGVGGGMNTGINIDASPLVFGVDLAKADQDMAKTDILKTILTLVKNGTIQMPEGKKFSDIAQQIDNYSTAVVKQPNVIPAGSNGKPAFTPAEFVISKIGFKPPVAPAPKIKPPSLDPAVQAIKAADLKQEAWEKAVLSGKLKADQYAKFLTGYDPESGGHKPEMLTTKSAGCHDLTGENDVPLGGTSGGYGTPSGPWRGELYGRPNGTVYVLEKDPCQTREYKIAGQWQTNPMFKSHAKATTEVKESAKGPDTVRRVEKQDIDNIPENRVKPPNEQKEPFDKNILTIGPGDGKDGKVITEQQVSLPGGGRPPTSRRGQEAGGSNDAYQQRLKAELEKLDRDSKPRSTKQDDGYDARLREALSAMPTAPPPVRQSPKGDDDQRGHMALKTSPSSTGRPTVSPPESRKMIPAAPQGNPLVGTYRGTLAITVQMTDARMARAMATAGINTNPREAVTVTVDKNGTITLRTSGGSFSGKMQGNRFTIPINTGQAAYTIHGQISGNSLTATGTGGESSGRAKGAISLNATK